MRTRYQLRTHFFVLKIRRVPCNFRLLAVISKKISKKAHRRNKVKRQVHAVFEQLKSTQNLPAHISLVVQATNKKVLEADFQEVKRDLLDGVAKLYFTYRNQEFEIAKKTKVPKKF